MSAPDPVDRWFPRQGACLICSVPGADQRHRVIEAIADAVRAGDGEEDVAADYGVPVEAVRACVAWVREHPDGLERVAGHESGGYPDEAAAERAEETHGLFEHSRPPRKEAGDADSR